MPTLQPDWKSIEGLAVGKGATVQEFVATVGDDRLEIEVAPWGEGLLKVNGKQIARIGDAKDRRQAFRELKKIAQRYLKERAVNPKARGAEP
jgi:enoyl-[acyl-carrier protein] reductase I